MTDPMDLDPQLRTYYLEADLRDYGRLNHDETMDSVRHGTTAGWVRIRPSGIRELVQQWRVLLRRKINLGARLLAANGHREAATWIRHGAEGSA